MLDTYFCVNIQRNLPRNIWVYLVNLRAEFKCENCGVDSGELEWKLQAHHIDEDKQNNRLSNGKLLCPSCHSEAHVWLRKSRTESVLSG